QGQSMTDAVFDVTVEVDDTYSFDVSKTAREGVFTTKIAARAIVDKKTHKVKQITPSTMTITVDGQQWDKVTSRADAERINPTDLKLSDYAFTLTAPMKWPADACELPDANFAIKKGTDAPIVVAGTAQAGKI